MAGIKREQLLIEQLIAYARNVGSPSLESYVRELAQIGGVKPDEDSIRAFVRGEKRLEDA